MGAGDATITTGPDASRLCQPQPPSRAPISRLFPLVDRADLLSVARRRGLGEGIPAPSLAGAAVT